MIGQVFSHLDSREAEEYYEGVAQAKADEYFNNQSVETDQRGKAKPEPKIEAKIHGHWYPVDLLEVIEVKTTDGFTDCRAVQVEVKRINGKQFKPFKGYLSKIYAGMESAIGSVPVDHIRVDGKRLEAK